MLRDSVVPKPPLLRVYGVGGLQLGLSAPSSSPLLHPTREATKSSREVCGRDVSLRGNRGLRRRERVF